MGQATFGFVSVILGAIILWEFATRVQQGIMTGFLEDVWTQNFMNFFASPLKVIEYLSGSILMSITTGVVGFLVATVLAGAAFGYNMFQAGLLLIPFMAILFLFGVAMGIFVSALIFKLGPTAEWLGWPIPMVISVFAGVFYPVSTLPKALQIIAHCIPASYIFDSVRFVLSGQAGRGELVSNLLIATFLSFVYLSLAYVFFIRIYHQNLRNGAIPQFSAESF